MTPRSDWQMICRMAGSIAGAMTTRLGDIGEEGVVRRSVSMAFKIADAVEDEFTRREEVARQAITGGGS